MDATRRTSAFSKTATKLRGFAKLNFFKKSKNNLEVGGWVQVPFGFLKKLENCPKITFSVCTIRPCLAVHMAPQGVQACSIYPVFCDSVAVRLTKIMAHLTSAMLFAPVHGGCYITHIYIIRR